MEKAAINFVWLRQKMAKAGITQEALAQEARIPQSAISAMLNNREYCGPKRALRLKEALLRLTIDPEHTTPPSDEPVEPRVRHL